jgi:hypothetical protein
MNDGTVTYSPLYSTLYDYSNKANLFVNGEWITALPRYNPIKVSVQYGASLKVTYHQINSNNSFKVISRYFSTPSVPSDWFWDIY